MILGIDCDYEGERRGQQSRMGDGQAAAALAAEDE
jgi:hypothetical protein